MEKPTNNNQNQLHQGVIEDIARLYETKYFKSLQELINDELETTKTYMLNLGLTNEQLRFYQGRAEGLGVVLLRIKKIHEDYVKENKAE
jgi:hypothetical protein